MMSQYRSYNLGFQIRKAVVGLGKEQKDFWGKACLEASTLVGECLKKCFDVESEPHGLLLTWFKCICTGKG